jgi:hypothetical protein
MKKGIVISNMITSKRGGYIHKGKEVSENDINNFDECVKNGHIKLNKVIVKEAPKKEVNKTK